MITQEEYKERRKKLGQNLPQGSIAIIPAAHEVVRNGDALYRFRQDSHFYYLTGFNEPEALLMVISGQEEQSILFNRPSNPEEERWTGRRLGQEKAVSELGVQKAFPLSRLEDELPKLLSDKSAIYYAVGRNQKLEKIILKSLVTVKDQVRRGIKVPESLCDLEPILGEMRLFKSKAEMKLMREASRSSVEAHKRAMRQCKQVQYEYELEAELIYEFTRQGCRSVAYDPIVACGENACILHYTKNDQLLEKGTLVLIDAGGEYENYAADITRTIPVNGRFSPEQKSIYNLVLKSQKAGIEAIKPGVPWDRVQQVILRILTEGLCALDLLKGNVEELIAQQAYRPFYMHNSGHWLGLDVHDSGVYKKNGVWRDLEPGMVLTVEPGLYISSNTPGVDRRWWGIAVRIEDDVLVTDNGVEVLTAALPVEIADIEALMCDK
jgi:Xaa-Pro aminopeptidase